MKRHWQQQNGNEIACDTCGNEISPTVSRCPFCKSKRIPTIPQQPGAEHRIVNLEKGMPIVAQALARLETEIQTARQQGCKVLTVIHGYGSSGKGGKIRQEVRRQLKFLKARRRIHDFIGGEDFKKRSVKTNQLLRRFSFLSTHSDLNRANRGVTLIIL